MLLVAPGLAHSGGATPVSDGSMVLLLTILGAISAAYLVAHFLMDRIQRRMLVTSGIEYVLLGVLLGSSSGVLSDPRMLAPVLAFAAGWIGLLDGSSLRIDQLGKLPKRALRLAMVDLIAVGGGVGLTGFALLHYGFDLPVREATLAGCVLGCAATSGSTSATRLLGHRFTQLQRDGDQDRPCPGSVYALVCATSRLTQTFAILAFGVVTCIFHEQSATSDIPALAAQWLVWMIGLGVTLGLLFRLLISTESTDNQRFMALVGIICFSTGAAFMLDLSALTVNLILGAILVQGDRGIQLQRSLETTRAPVVLLLLVLGGVVWVPVPIGSGAAIVAVAVLARLGFKLLSGAVAAAGTPVRPDIGRGFMAQGEVAICIALSYRLLFSGDAVELVFTAILVSVVLSEVAAPRMLRGLLVDAGELRQDLAMSRDPEPGERQPVGG
ncbi:MAG: hypothetical protein CL927_01400 [Deltaproteobacteria bacterium]|nr:hypothetical protein [Deltaproteobacteria bacterium]